MKIIRHLVIFVSAIVLLASGVAAAQMERSQTDIENEVRKKILHLPNYDVFDIIGFKVEGSTVTLYGKVRNSINRPSAENSVKGIPGVETVVNNIQLLPVSRVDDDIRRRLYRRMVRTTGLLKYFLPVNTPVRLIVEHGHITLEGSVATRGDYNLMYITARGVPGTFSVTNNLQIEKGVLP